MDGSETTAEVLDLPKAKVGWIGAGKMGNPMVRNLLSAGASVRVSEPVAHLRDAAAEVGATIAETLSDHAESQIVFATLPNDQSLLDVVFGTEGDPGLAEILSENSNFVEMSTVSPECSERVARKLASKEISYLRAPLSGSTALAEQAALTILASGSESAWQAALPYLKAMSKQQFYLGQGEGARYMKLVLNTLVGASSALLAEALSLGASGGLSHKDMMEVIGESAVASPLFKYKANAVVAGDYSPAFTVDQMIKDFSLITDAAQRKGVPLMTTGLILELYRAAANAGLHDSDFFSLVKWHRKLSER